jgi:hypothetical protein
MNSGPNTYGVYISSYRESSGFFMGFASTFGQGRGRRPMVGLRNAAEIAVRHQRSGYGDVRRVWTTLGRAELRA